MRKILLIGGFGYSDVGDEAQLTVCLVNLKKFIRDAQFFVLSDNPEHTRRNHHVETDYSINHYLKTTNDPGFKQIEKILNLLEFARINFLLKSLILLLNALRLRKGKNVMFLSVEGERFLRNIKNADLLFNVGGGNLTSIFRSELYGKCLTYILCRIFRIPVILSGQTIGPLYGWFDRHLTKFALNGVDVITLRENFSKAALEEIGVTKPVIKVTADDSTLLDSASKEEIENIFSEEKIPIHRPLVAIGMNGLKTISHLKVTKSIRLLARLADYLIFKYNARIIFVSMNYREDKPIAEKVLKMMQYSDGTNVIMHEYNDRIIKGIIAQMDLAVGLRYHFIVFAVNSGVPSVGIYLNYYYLMKIKGILTLVDQGKYAFDIEELSLKDLEGAVDDAFQNRAYIRKKLTERTESLGQASLFSAKFAAMLILRRGQNNIRNNTKIDTQSIPN
ncbi:MAG: polysaccharide pyruvyl transferase family protein [Candidatus Bathyarchaeia archaeon]